MRQQRKNLSRESRMVEMIALRGHVTTDGEMVLAGHPFEVAEDEANRYRAEYPHLAVRAAVATAPATAVAGPAAGDAGVPAPTPRSRKKARP